MTFYIATKEQKNGRDVRQAINDIGHSCNSSWLDVTTYGSIPQTAGMRREAALQDAKEIAEADALILVSEPDRALVRGGKHVETGIAIALGKPVYVIGEPENVFHWHPLVTVHPTLEAMLGELQ